MPCQCSVLVSDIEFVTSMRTCSPRDARNVGPRNDPSTPSVGVSPP